MLNWVCLLMIGFQALAEPPLQKQILLKNKTQNFLEFKDERILVSENCTRQGKLTGCAALDSLKKASLKKLTPDTDSNPGSQICEEQFQAQVEIGMIPGKKNEISLCVFKDDSMLDSGSLFFHARKNDLAEK